MDSFVAKLNLSVSPKNCFLALKSIQYGFSTNKDCPGAYQEKWDTLSEAQFKEKIKKILAKIAPEKVKEFESLQAKSKTEPVISGRHRAHTFGALPPLPVSKTSVIERSPSSSPSHVEASPSSSPISALRNKLAKAGSFLVKRANSSSAISISESQPPSPKKQHSPISVVRIPSKEEGLSETSSQSTPNDIAQAKRKSQEKEVYFWDTEIIQ